MPASFCTRCKRTFRSTAAFDEHRQGKYDINAPGYGRRCMTEPELVAAGFEPDAHQRWRVPMPVTVRLLRGNQRVPIATPEAP